MKQLYSMRSFFIRLSSSLFLIIFFSTILFAQTGPYSRVKVYTGTDGMAKMSKAGIAVDHGDHRPGVWFIGDFSSEEVELIKQLGLRYEVQINDLIQNFIEKKDLSVERSASVVCNTPPPFYPVPAGFTLGSMGGFFTYSEMLDHLDQMAALYPNLISVKQAIGTQTTHEGRPIYFVKISDNPNVNEAEPQVLYSSVHHAREPVSMSQLIFYMYYVLEHFGTDPLITQLVNETEMYFIPCINPDGYIYNEITNPFGGGFWRKNRRDNLDGTMGVDLNRNYGYNWGFDNSGSSPQTSSETYRGPSGFSEPETQLMRDFCNTKQFKIALNYHAYSNLLIYPWGYDYSIYTPDSARFVNYGQLLTRHNKYVHGTADQTVGYIVNGSSDDWMYGEQNTKPVTFAMTPEVGTPSDGFWPNSSRIIPLCQENVWPNLNLALLAGKYAIAKDLSAAVISGSSGKIQFSLSQIGLDTTGTFTVSIVPLQPTIATVSPSLIIGPLNSLQTSIDSFSYSITPGTTYGTALDFVLEVNTGILVFRDTIHKIVGAPSVSFYSAASSMSGYSGGWGLSSTHYVSSPTSFADSPIGNYNSNTFSSLESGTLINLNGASSAYLKFKTRFEIEPSWDYAQVLVSSNGGANWDPLCGKYTKAGSNFQIPGEPIYDGFQNEWVSEEMNLEDYLGMNVLFKFDFASDGFQEFDGIYVDDISVEISPAGITGIFAAINDQPLLGQNIPNPVHGSTYINYQEVSRNSVLRIIDALGRTIFESKLINASGNVQVNTEGWQRGVYFYFVEGEGMKSESFKMVVY